MMRLIFIILGAFLLIQLFTTIGLAQQERLQGRWEGTVQSLQGERQAVATFKKEGDSYTGTITGMRGDMPLKEIKLAGDKITAKAEVETPQGNFLINYSFVLEGETLKGKGEVDFGGQTFSFDINLKRAGEQTAQAAAAASQPRPQSQRPRADVPQPQQKQSLDYFAGQWNFKWLGRDSALGPGSREGTVTFTKSADGKSLEGHIVGKSDEGSYQEKILITYDEATKTLTFYERRSNGVEVRSKGDWSSPLAIRFTIDPIKVKGQNIQLRRTISVVAAHSFTVVEEISEDGSAFVRLGNAIFSKANP